MAILISAGREVRANDTLYLRLKCHGVTTDFDGVQKAVCSPMKADGSFDPDDVWFFRESILCKSAVVQADIDARAEKIAGERLANKDAAR